jgi:hypothetical protein
MRKRQAEVVATGFTTSCTYSYYYDRKEAKFGVQLFFVAAADYDATTRKLQCLSLKRELVAE